MGGVDLLNSLMSLHRCKLKSKKYYHRIFYHFLNVTIVNSWLLYRRDCEAFDVPKSKQFCLLNFKVTIAEVLSKEEQVTSKKHGRPSTILETNYQEKKHKGHSTKPIPEKSIRLDNVDHFPVLKEKANHCMFPSCKGYPSIFCTKCKIYLCLDKKKNCF